MSLPGGRPTVGKLSGGLHPTHHLLGDRDGRNVEADAAQEALHDQLVAVIQERDAVRRALDAERATRRRDRARQQVAPGRDKPVPYNCVTGMSCGRCNRRRPQTINP